VFPTFRRPQGDESPTTGEQNPKPEEDVKAELEGDDVKPQVRKAARPGEYVAGEWGGWGKGGGRQGRDPIGGGVDGLVGRMQVHASGKVRLKMGDIEYDVRCSSMLCLIRF
jgi:hypothetical protein